MPLHCACNELGALATPRKQHSPWLEGTLATSTTTTNFTAKPPSPSRRSSAALRCAGMLGAALLVGNLHRAQRPHGRRAGVCSLCPAGTRLDTSALWHGRLCHGGARHSHRAAILWAVASVRTQPQQRGAGNVAAVRWVHAPARHLPPARASRRHQSLLCFPPPRASDFLRGRPAAAAVAAAVVLVHQCPEHMHTSVRVPRSLEWRVCQLLPRRLASNHVRQRTLCLLCPPSRGGVPQAPAPGARPVLSSHMQGAGRVGAMARRRWF